MTENSISYERKEKNGKVISSFILKSSTCQATIISYGATLTNFMFDSCAGSSDAPVPLPVPVDVIDVIHGFDDPFLYISNTDNSYFGAFIGRACNRTKNGEFSMNGQNYQLPINNGPNSLHGGLMGLDKCFFESQIISSNPPSVKFTATSPHMDQGFPGTVKFALTYILKESTLSLTSEAVLIDDIVQETYVNLTVHPYFNLSGMREATVQNHEFEMNPNMVVGCLELDSNQIPTGKVLDSTTNPEFFFYKSRKLKETLPLVQTFRGYDHFYMLSPDREKCPFLTVKCPSSNIQLRINSDSDSGFQFYTGNWLDGKIPCKATQNPGYYNAHSAFCIEPSEPPNSVNMPQYRNGVIITKGKPWKQSFSYSFSLL